MKKVFIFFALLTATSVTFNVFSIADDIINKEPFPLSTAILLFVNMALCCHWTNEAIKD